METSKPNFCESCAGPIATCDCVTPRPTVVVYGDPALESETEGDREAVESEVHYQARMLLRAIEARDPSEELELRAKNLLKTVEGGQ